MALKTGFANREEWDSARLKRELQRRSGLEPSHMILHYNGVEVDDGWFLRELGLSASDNVRASGCRDMYLTMSTLFGFCD